MLELPTPQPWVEPHRRRWIRRRCEPRAARPDSADDSEAELAALAHGSGPLRRALARVAGRMVAVRGWERLGFARLEDYAAERAGMSARELRELALVDRALAQLPELDAAFRAGEIGWTQVRLLCRTGRLRGDEHRVAVLLHCTPAARARWWHARQVANRVAGRALSSEAFAEAVAAEVWSARPFPAPGADAGAESAPREAARAAPDLHPVAALERSFDAVDPFELDARLRRAARLEARRLARVATLLESVVERARHRALGFGGLDAYAEQRLGMAPSRARALLRVARASRRCPQLGQAFRSGRLSWVQAHALVPVLLEPGGERHRAAWVEHAARVSVRRLRDDVGRALATGNLAPGGALQTGAISRSRDETARVYFAAAPEVAHLFRAALAAVQRRLVASPSRALEAMLDHAVATWCEGADEHAVFDRDGWRCTAPGCSSYRNLHAHHIVLRSAGGSDDTANLTTLCAWHHLRGVHAGVVRCTGTAPDALHFELGVRAGRPPLAAYGPGEVIDSRSD